MCMLNTLVPCRRHLHQQQWEFLCDKLCCIMCASAYSCLHTILSWAVAQHAMDNSYCQAFRREPVRWLLLISWLLIDLGSDREIDMVTDHAPLMPVIPSCCSDPAPTQYPSAVTASPGAYATPYPSYTDINGGNSSADPNTALLPNLVTIANPQCNAQHVNYAVSAMRMVQYRDSSKQVCNIYCDLCKVQTYQQLFDASLIANKHEKRPWTGPTAPLGYSTLMSQALL